MGSGCCCVNDNRKEYRTTSPSPIKPLRANEKIEAMSPVAPRRLSQLQSSSPYLIRDGTLSIFASEAKQSEMSENDGEFSDIFSKRSHKTSLVPAKHRLKGMKRASGISQMTDQIEGLSVYLDDLNLQEKPPGFDDVIKSTNQYMMRQAMNLTSGNLTD